MRLDLVDWELFWLKTCFVSVLPVPTFRRIQVGHLFSEHWHDHNLTPGLLIIWRISDIQYQTSPPSSLSSLTYSSPLLLKIKGTWTRRGQTKLRQVDCCSRIQPYCGEPLNPPSGCKDFDHLLQLLSTQTSKNASSSLVIVAGSFSARRRQFNKLKRRFFFSPKASSTWWLSAPSIVDWNIWTDLVTNKQCLLCQAMSSTIWDNRKSCFKFCLHYLTFDFYFLIIVSFSEMLMLPRIYRVIKCNCVLWFVTDSEMAVN